MRKYGAIITNVLLLSAYTAVNHTTVFVGWLGCGCIDGFNANALSNCVYVGGAGVMLLATYRSEEKIDEGLRRKRLTTMATLAAVGFVPFYFFNWWR